MSEQNGEVEGIREEGGGKEKRGGGEKSREGVRVVQVTDNFHFISFVIKFCNYFFSLSS